MLTRPGKVARPISLSFVNNGLAGALAPMPVPRWALVMLSAALILVMAACGSAASNPGSTTTAPTITTFAPSSGASGTIVVLIGKNFTGATAVKFNGIPASNFSVDNATQITATVA